MLRCRSPSAATGALPATNFTVNDYATLSIEVSETAPDGDPAIDNARAGFTVPASSTAVSSITGQRAGVTRLHPRRRRAEHVGRRTGRPRPHRRLHRRAVPDRRQRCDAAAVSALSTNGAGALAGTVTVPSGATVGTRAVKVTNGGRFAPVPDRGARPRTRLAQPRPAAGSAPSSRSPPSNFDPTAAVTIQGLRDTGRSGGLQRCAGVGDDRRGRWARGHELHGERPADHLDRRVRGRPRRHAGHRPGLGGVRHARPVWPRSTRSPASARASPTTPAAAMR